MKIFGGCLAMLLITKAITAKEVSDVFTSFNSIVKSTDYQSNTRYPFDWYKVELGWSIDAETVTTGDTFTLKMPYVYEVRILREGELRNYFDITSNGKSIASCDVDAAGGRSLDTTITCKLTADLSQYSSLSGTVDFVVVLDNGGRKETINSANHWKIGTNTVTFNDKLSSQVSFNGVDTAANQFLSRITMRGDTFYYYAAPCDMCQGRTISSGSFVFDILDDGYQLKEADTEAYVTNSLNSFGFPGAVQDLEISSKTLQNGNQRVSINFGRIDSGSRFWFSTFSDKIDTVYREYTVKSTLSVSCSGGGFDFDSHTTTLSPVRGCAVGAGSGNSRPVTITTTEIWAQCTESTKFVTGSGSTVTEIVEVPNSSLCATSALTTSCSSKTSKKTTSSSTNSTPQVPTLKTSKSCSSTSHGPAPRGTSCSTKSVRSKTSVSSAGSSSTENSSSSGSKTCLKSSSSGSVYSSEASSYPEKLSSSVESTSSTRTTFCTQSNFSAESSSITEVNSSSEGSSTISDVSHTGSSSSIAPSFSTTSLFSIESSSSTESLSSNKVSFTESSSSNEISSSIEMSLSSGSSSSSTRPFSSNGTSLSTEGTSSTQSTSYSDVTSSSEVSSFSEQTYSDIKSSGEKPSCTEASSSTERSSSDETSSTKITSSNESSSTLISSIEPSGCSGPSCLTSSTKSSSIMASSSVVTSSTLSTLTSSSENSSTTILTRSSEYRFSSGYWNSSVTESPRSRTSSVLTQLTSDTVTSLTVTSFSRAFTSSATVTIISSSLTGSSSLSSSPDLSASKNSTTYVLPSSFVTTSILNSHSTPATGQTTSSTAAPENGKSYGDDSSLESFTVPIANNSDVPEENTVSPINLDYVTATIISQKDSTITLKTTVRPTTTITPSSTIDTTPKEQLRSSDTAVEHGNQVTTSTPVPTDEAASYSGSVAQSSSNTSTPLVSSSTIHVTSSSSSSPAVTILEGLGSMMHLSGLLALVALFINTIFI